MLIYVIISLQNSSLETQLMVLSCERISTAAHAVSKSIKPITHHVSTGVVWCNHKIYMTISYTG